MKINRNGVSSLYFSDSITPKSVKVYYEDSAPYLDYYGYTYINNQRVIIHFPKIGLQFDKVHSNEERSTAYTMCHGKEIPVATFNFMQNIYIGNDEYFDYEILPVEITKAEIEKQLGYPINIVESK